MARRPRPKAASLRSSKSRRSLTGLSTDERGQTTTLAYAILLSLALVSAMMLAGIGVETLDRSQQQAETYSANHGMTQLDSQASLVALGGATQQTVDLGNYGRGSKMSVEQNGWFRVSLYNASTGTKVATVMNRSLGKVVYSSENARIAYQGGGVWSRRTGENGSTMVSPPEIHYSGRTLTLPLIGVNGSVTTGRAIQLQNGGTDSVFPIQGNETLSNPVSDRRVQVTIQSEYYQAWGDFFKERIGGEITYDHAREIAVVSLVTPDANEKIRGALGSVGAGERIKISGTGSSTSFVDSYDSRAGSYSTTAGSNGTIMTPAGVRLSGHADIYGDITTTGDVILKGNSIVHGNVSHQSGVYKQGQNSEINGWVAQNGTSFTYPIADREIQERLKKYKQPSNNDNDATSYIQNNELLLDAQLESGNYYINDSVVVESGEDLIFDVSQGNITLVVDGHTTINGDVHVVGNDDTNHRVKIWMADEQVSMHGGTVTTEDDESPAFWLYGPKGTTVEMKSNSTFMGVVYAPGTNDVPGSATVRSNSEVYGAVIAGTVTLSSGSEIHYDEALRNEDALEQNFGVYSLVSYFHVSYYRVNVSSV